MSEQKPEENNLTAGGKIREFRIKADCSIKEMSERTKIQPGVIKLIENDGWEKTLAAATWRGFVRILARELKFNPEEIFKTAEKSKTLSEPEKKRIFLLPLVLPRFNYWLYLGTVILIILLLHWLSRIFVLMFWK